MAHTIRDARKQLSEIVKEAAKGTKEIEIGRRGIPEATVIGSARLKRMKRELQQLQELRRGFTLARVPSVGKARKAAAPYAGLTKALETGELKAAPGPRERRRIAGVRTESGIPLEAQARVGKTGTREPRFRRVRSDSPPEAGS